ncbi:hypothetical protein GWI33_000572 [Rhynchophorus ferrugineus]|uniref:Uncharacterized protein n=1 Tax=Rhynchophorus ferrugineus TaxID=354439 RepID=A0A834IR33_RHYFE|nr:hypothetical protein GWI33_000572 [Rhynchophorus ferrugineus]
MGLRARPRYEVDDDDPAAEEDGDTRRPPTQTKTDSVRIASSVVTRPWRWKRSHEVTVTQDTSQDLETFESRPQQVCDSAECERGEKNRVAELEPPGTGDDANRPGP